MLFGPSFLWGLIGLLLIVSEMIIPGFTIFFFGLGALLVSLVALVFPFLSGSFAWQIVLWMAASVFSFVFLRKRFRRLFRGTLLDRMPTDDVGERAVVLEAISPEKAGRVRYRGTSWKAVSLTESFEAGDEVSIIEEDGITLTVTAPFDTNIKEEEL